MLEVWVGKSLQRGCTDENMKTKEVEREAAATLRSVIYKCCQDSK